MVAFSKSLLFAAIALLIPSAVLAQTEIPQWPDVAISADGAADPEFYPVKRAVVPAPVSGGLSNGERLARGLAPRGPNRMYRPRDAAPATYSPTPQKAMSRTYHKQFCVNTINNKEQAGLIITGVSTERATNICAARADGSGPMGYDEFAITGDSTNGFLCYINLSGLAGPDQCMANNFAYYSTQQPST